MTCMSGYRNWILKLILILVLIGQEEMRIAPKTLYCNECRYDYHGGYHDRPLMDVAMCVTIACCFSQ